MDDAAAPDHVSDLTPSLVGKLRAGDAGAAAFFNELYRDALIRFCWGYLGSMEEAEDAFEEVICKVLQTTTVPENFRPWVYQIARNHCLKVRQQARRRAVSNLPSDSRLGNPRTGPLSRLVRHEDLSRLGHLIATLPDEQREPLRLRYVEGLSRTEIAYVLGIDELLVKSRLCEGLRKLRAHRSLLGGS